MNSTPAKLKKKWRTEDTLGVKRVCMRAEEGNCDGRITKEHAIIFAGKQWQEEWSILDICAYHHEVDRHQDGDGMNKEKHIFLALARASDEELRKISRAVDYIALRDRLALKYRTC